MQLNPMRRARSQCCLSNINYLPGKEGGECAKCGSPSFHFAEDGELESEDEIRLQADMEVDHTLYLLGIQRAARETSHLFQEP